jgi:hypothetical protein
VSHESKFVVVVARLSFDGEAFHTAVTVLGPFRRLERAEARAATVRRLAAKYDEPAGTLHVNVEPIVGGSSSAQHAMDVLYGAVEA